MGLLLLGLVPNLASAPTASPLPTGPGVALGWDCCGPETPRKLGAAWWVDYRSANSRIAGPGQVYLVEPQIPLAALQGFAALNPGHAWILGNEPNAVSVYGDPCGSPRECKTLWGRQREAIRSGDPGAAFISAGLADGDLEYAKSLVDVGADRFDAWNLHLYARTANADWVIDRVREFRAWQVARGDPRPLIVGEVGIAPDEPDSLAAPVLNSIAQAFPILGVRAWAWFSVRSVGRWRGDLLTDNGTPTEVGRVYRGLRAGSR